MISELDIDQADIFSKPENDNLLCWVQTEIFELSFRNSRQPLSSDALLTNQGEFPKKIIKSSDKSIEIHVAHSKLRELEVLKDPICHWFETEQTDLSLRML